MAINLLQDAGAPVMVAGVNIMARQSTSVIMGQPIADVLTYGMTAAGYLAAYMGWGGRNNELFKNIGIAAAPLAIEKLYNKLKGTSVTRSVAMGRVARYPAPANESPFQDVRISRLV